MIVVREVDAGATRSATAALLAFRSHFEADELVRVIDHELRPVGYRMVGVFETGADDQALAVAGFRVTYALVRGRHLVVDEMVTRPDHRGQGHADRLMTWLVAEAGQTGCGELHLDSGVQPERAAAHRLYMRHHLRISAHHFHREIHGNA